MISFFSYLKILEKEVMSDSDFGDECKTATQKLIGYVECGSYAPGNNTEWICKRWRLPVKELREEWKEQTGVDKSEAAFRSQICALSKILFKLFPEEDFGEILSEDMAEGQKPRIVQTLEALKYDKVSFGIMFSDEINEWAMKGNVKDYSLDELQDEIRVLSVYIRVMTKIMTANPEKIAYIKRVIDARVVDNPKKTEMLVALGLC